MMFLLNGAPIFWMSRKQSMMTAFSSALAEIFALSESVRAAQLLVWRAEELGARVTWPLCIQVDNNQSITFQRATCLMSRLRGCIDMRWGWVKELRDMEKIMTKKVESDMNLADVLTKCLPPCKFVRMMKRIRGDQESKNISAFMAWLRPTN